MFLIFLLNLHFPFCIFVRDVYTAAFPIIQWDSLLFYAQPQTLIFFLFFLSIEKIIIISLYIAHKTCLMTDLSWSNVCVQIISISRSCTAVSDRKSLSVDLITELLSCKMRCRYEIIMMIIWINIPRMQCKKRISKLCALFFEDNSKKPKTFTRSRQWNKKTFELNRFQVQLNWLFFLFYYIQNMLYERRYG